MNLTKLQQAEQQFLQRYPLGFRDPEMLALTRKHKMSPLIDFAQQEFAQSRFKNSQSVSEAMSKLVSRSSMVSMFEKPKFRDYVAGIGNMDRKMLTDGLKEFLHGDQQKGFDQLVSTLAPASLAKWSLLTILPNYYAPDDEVFINPTTAKGVIEHFELGNLHYSAKPTWEFYRTYRDTILAMREKVDKSLAPNNAAFCGFLMISLVD